MQVRTLTMSPAAISTSLYGDNSNFMSNYLQHQMDAMGAFGGQVNSFLLDMGQNSFNFFNDMSIQYGIQDELERCGMIELNSYIMPLTTFEGLQQANITMQRFIMAHPAVRQLYLDQNLDGYSETYIQPDFGYEYGVGDDDPNYRRVMNGAIVCHDAEDEYTITRYHADPDMIEGDEDLVFDDSVDVRATYDYINWFMANSKYDFTLNSETPGKMNR